VTDRVAWMRTQFDHAARRHSLTSDGPTLGGVRDRTISGRVTNHETTRWLRVIAVATDHAHGVAWDGPIAATEITGVRRPELLTARVFAHPAVAELINLQAEAGQAKRYQVRQVASLIRRYDLRLEGRR